MMTELFSPPPVTPRWKFWLARLFGTRVTGMDQARSGVLTIVRMYRWRGALYVWSIQERG